MFRIALPVALFLAFFATSVVSADDCGCASKCRMVKRYCLEKVTCEKEVTRFRLKCVKDECGCPRLRLCKETCTKEVTRLKLKPVCVEKCRKCCISMPKLMKPCCEAEAEGAEAPAPEAAK